MVVWKPYTNLVGYLHRFTVIKIGRLHIRFHKILTPDETPFYHTHPFHYCSIILRGAYSDLVDGDVHHRQTGSVVFRRNTTPHQIVSVAPNTLTLFITWETKGGWEFKGKGHKAKNWVEYTPGIYSRQINGKLVYAKFDGFWYRGHPKLNDAENERKASIHQKISGNLVKVL